MNDKQRAAFEANLLEREVPRLVAKCHGQLSLASAENIVKATWLPRHPGTDEYKAQGTVELFELWKAAQAAVVVELPALPAGHEVPQNAQEWGWELIGKFRIAIEAAGGTVKHEQ